MAEHLSNAIRDVIAERVRQQHSKNYSPERDARYGEGELSAAAAAYALAATLAPRWRKLMLRVYPWPLGTFTPHAPGGDARSSRRRNAVRAAALCIADIERLDREADALRVQAEASANDGAPE